MQFIGSPNFTAGRGGYTVTGVILHWMDGTLASTDQVFQNRVRNTSAHYGIEDSVVHQYVQDVDTAYQAGNWIVNEQTIGIEHSAQPGRPPSDATYECSAQLVAQKSKQFGFPVDAAHIRHHYVIVATACPGPMPGDGVDEQRILNRALEILGGVQPSPAPAPAPIPLSAAGTATVEVDLLYVRSQPSSSAPLAGSMELTRGQTFDYVQPVQGEAVGGVSTWLQSTRGNFVWAGGTDFPTTPVVNTGTGGRAEAIRVANVRTAPNTSAPLGGSQHVQPGKTFDYTAKVHGQLVSQNGVTTDLWYHSTLGNYVWTGNCEDV